MSLAKVLNVGHGDCMILTPPNGCLYNSKTIFVDLGPGQVDITKHISETERVHIFISHHDADHLNGLKFFSSTMGRVNGITVPLYQNEITLIAKCILSLKGMREAKDCGEFIRLLEDILENQIYLKKITSETMTGPQLSFGFESKCFWKHIICLNPPIVPDTFNWLRESSLNALTAVVNDIFEPAFAKSFNNYLRGMASGYQIEDAPDIQYITLEESEDVFRNNNAFQRKGSYVVDFIMHNLELFRRFNAAPNRENLRVVYECFQKCSHDMCMVLKVEFLDKTFLLTGDASKKVFNRLIENGSDLSADYLKMPHHGSIKNISIDILRRIHPKAVIISHNNRRFGKASDTLPNTEVLAALEKLGIQIMLTNNVCKNGVSCLQKSEHLGDEYVEIL
ncbi:MAG: hypothetical protein IKO68_13550 [Oscillospiraceae bacterium]|nr:hypothetical protein [Oscillospiraceae bacterium]